MSLFLIFTFLFYIGSTIGWVIELFFRRLYYKKWINPGFLVGPYLPIYGFGLCILTFMYIVFSTLNCSLILMIILMGLAMTLIELIAGLIFIKGMGVKLWDYSNNFLNYKGIICPLFSFIWTLIGTLYYFFLAKHVIKALDWFSKNISFSFVLGIFFGIFILDLIYSTKILVKIKKFAKENDIIVKYEEFKEHIKEHQNKIKEKYSFIFAFKQNNPLREYLETYKQKNK